MKGRISKIFGILVLSLLLISLLTACFGSNFVDGVNIDGRKFGIGSDERKYGNAEDYAGFAYKYNDEIMTFRLKSPEKIEEGKSYPLIIFLHGAGDWGHDNVNQMYRSLINSVDRYVREDCYVFMPQTAKNHNWREKISGGTSNTGFSEIYNHCLDNYILKELQVDLSRVYLTGMSMGGNGTMYQGSKFPEKYAAIMPLCGFKFDCDLSKLVDMPIWISHSRDDDAVDFEESFSAYNELVALGNQNIKNSWYDNQGHQITQKFYDNQEVWDWLLASKNKG